MITQRAAIIPEGMKAVRPFLQDICVAFLLPEVSHSSLAQSSQFCLTLVSKEGLLLVLPSGITEALWTGSLCSTLSQNEKVAHS